MIIATLFFSFTITQCKKETIVKITNPEYTIGVIDTYQPSSGRTIPFIKFHYTVNGSVYNAKYSDGYNGWYVPSKNLVYNVSSYNTGDEYVVQYSLSNPNVARMYFYYKIDSIAEFRKDTVLFKTNPPNW